MLTIGLPGFLAFVCYYVIVNLFAHYLAARNSGNRFGKALAVLS